MSSPVQPGSSPSPARRAAPWIIGGLCGLLAVLLVIVLAIGAIWYFALRSTPQGTVEQYLEAWDAQDCETYEKVTTERFRGGEEYSCEEWTSTLQEEHGYEFEDEIGKTTIDGDRASVEIDEVMTEPDGDKYRLKYTFDLIKQDGRWVIDTTTTLQEPRPI